MTRPLLRDCRICGFFVMAAASALMLSAADPGESFFPAAKDHPLIQEKFFPGLRDLPPENIFWVGLASLYPGRVLLAPPPSAYRPETIEPLQASLPRGISYIRVYDLDAAIPALREAIEATALIVDLRYVHADYPESAAFASLWGAGSGSLVERIRSAPDSSTQTEYEATPQTRAYPFIALVNHRTAGALEAFLDAMQREGWCMTVGTPTAGMTGNYKQLPDAVHFWLIDAEWRARSGTSLLGTGLQPEVGVEVSPDDDYLAYQRALRGIAVEHTLQHPSPADRDHVENSGGHTPDPILQRAYEIIAALQILGKLPPS